jgi:hypothetical protein
MQPMKKFVPSVNIQSFVIMLCSRHEDKGLSKPHSKSIELFSVVSLVY